MSGGDGTEPGAEVAVVIDIAEYSRLMGETVDVKEFLLSAPHFDDEFIADLETVRSGEPARTVELTD